MLRIHFTPEDLVRVRVAPTYGPLVEAMFGFRALRTGGFGAVPELWRRRVIRGQPHWAAPLSEVLGPESAFDIFTLLGRASTAAEGLESVAAMSRHRLGTEIEATVRWRERRRLDAKRWPSAWVNTVAADVAPGRILAPLIEACHDAVVAPYWGHIRRQLALEVAARTQLTAANGIEALFRSLHPTVRWHSPALELPSHPGPPADVHLNGRGIELVATVFLSTVEGPFWNAGDPSAPAVLFYPAVPCPADAATIFTADTEATASGGGGDGPLAELMGRTRAAALAAIAGGCTTSALARRVGISKAGASQHASVLRRSGLVTTVRNGSSVVHELTPLGRSLLAGSDPRPLPIQGD
ncbi:helix-turn-helix domain-containing protein [Rugosimonospora africana]|uniref:Transcriptional regulator n=1 Tax=Rugosimonospora africana TaxID=556532 RepID=A0A8J3VSP4_9ACTN|nr:helix-turn-helix domain-containing protein [Rugosimonospora africana]GIH16826.1 transcriptional regulator [Rugosimonospora africana]